MLFETRLLRARAATTEQMLARLEAVIKAARDFANYRRSNLALCHDTELRLIEAIDAFDEK